MLSSSQNGWMRIRIFGVGCRETPAFRCKRSELCDAKVGGFESTSALSTAASKIPQRRGICDFASARAWSNRDAGSSESDAETQGRKECVGLCLDLDCQKRRRRAESLETSCAAKTDYQSGARNPFFFSGSTTQRSTATTSGSTDMSSSPSHCSR